MKKILDVPYYSEFEKIDNSNKHQNIFKRRSCGIVSLKMVLDFLSKVKGSDKVDLSELIDSALKHHAYRLQLGGRKNYGWIHAGLVRTVHDFDFLAWRHAFLIRPDDIRTLGKENNDRNSINAYRKQIISEAMYTFKKSIDNNEPFLVSINKNLGKKVTPHLVVVTGYELEKERLVGLYINDPNNPKKNGERKQLINQFIKRADFVKMWRKTAIFVR